MPKPTFARQSSCAGRAGLPCHLCPPAGGSDSFLPFGGAGVTLRHFPRARARCELLLPLAAISPILGVQAGSAALPSPPRAG